MKSTEELDSYIRLRAVECGDCLLWQGSTSCRGGMPVMYWAETQTNRHVRPIAYAIHHGPVPLGKVVSARCGNKMCVAPEHLIAVKLRDAQIAAAKRGVYGKPAAIRKTAMKLRAKSWITDEIVAQVRAAASSREAHEQTGVSLSHAKSIRSGKYRRDWSSPFAGLGARA